MANRVVQVVNDFKGGRAADWASKNPILRQDEPGWERDTGKMKIGNGIDTWNNLPYTGSNSDPGGGGDYLTEEDLEEHIESPAPHTVYDDGPSLALLYQNAKV